MVTMIERGPDVIDPEPVRDRFARHDDVAAAVFSTWVVVGLFVDGWAHNADKPEDFWTPWHALLYSGFVAGALYFGSVRYRRARRGVAMPDDPFVLAGFALFAAAGVGDMVWHSIFGVEENVEALLSPTHLTLMIGGLFLVTAPVRSALARAEPVGTFRAFAPVAVGITLATAVIAFFVQFSSAMRVFDEALYAATADESTQIAGVVSVLVANVVLLGAIRWTSAHWSRPPLGTFALVLGGTGLLMAALSGFDHLPLLLAFVAGGVVADVAANRDASAIARAIAVPVVLWSVWFATYHATVGLGWAPELWTGTIVLATLTGVGLELLAAPAVAAAEPVTSARPATRATALGDGTDQRADIR